MPIWAIVLVAWCVVSVPVGLGVGWLIRIGRKEGW